MQEPEVCQEERAIHSQDDEVPLAVVYPRSFSSLLPSCQSEAEKMKIQSTCSSLDPSLRSQIMVLLMCFLFQQMYMEDSAFQEMLMTVDRVMEELEADSPLQSNKLQQITW
ncbi:hypothetical protein SAY86_020408 [Trapa natans]|uniref:Uncharacterized protein n=1 Tax=Trapa natans TaxID=22666 RepID=A0AAN7LQI7_TRANT|nr:hypothetical protein SAY86_020408 [Trapa natans]